MTLEALLVIAGSLAGGFVNGLTGFGTAQASLPLLLQAVQPSTAAMLAATLSVAGHVQTFPAVWRFVNWRRAGPLILGGLIGIPIGTALLPHIPLATFKLGVGVAIMAYSLYALRGGLSWQVRGWDRMGDVLVGFGGGVMGGLAGLSGMLPVVWAGLQGWSKDERRGVFQAYNAAILTVTLLAGAVSDLLTPAFFSALVWALPAAVIGTFIGVRIYRRLDERRFDRLVLYVLLVAGLALVVSSQVASAS